MKLAVIGVGTAGVQSLSYFCAWLGSEWEITSIYDPNINILGIGESSTPRLPQCLYMGSGFSFGQDAHELDATIKHYVKYVNWREHDIYSVIDTGSYGIHFNNGKLKDFVFNRLTSIWGDKFNVVTGNVTNLENVDRKVKVVVDEKEFIYDYVIDCRGYPEDYSDYTISDSLPLNKCFVYTKDEPGDWDYTYHYAHKNGWMFGIPLTNRQGWGYLHNDKISSREECVEDIMKIFDLKEEPRLKEFSFKPYYANKIMDGNILKNGNRFLFFEPLEALSAFYYDEANYFLLEHLRGNKDREEINEVFSIYSRLLELFICYIYHGGSNYDTPFWRYAKEITSKKLIDNSMFEKVKEVLSGCRSNPNLGEIIKPFASWNWHKLDKQFGYNYFDK